MPRYIFVIRFKMYEVSKRCFIFFTTQVKADLRELHTHPNTHYAIGCLILLKPIPNFTLIQDPIIYHKILDIPDFQNFHHLVFAN